MFLLIFISTVIISNVKTIRKANMNDNNSCKSPIVEPTPKKFKVNLLFVSLQNDFFNITNIVIEVLMFLTQLLVSYFEIK